MKRSLSAALLATGVLAAVLAPAQPASAFKGEGLTVKLNQSFTVERPAIPGNSVVFQGSYQASDAFPADCEGEAFGCEVVPIKLDIKQTDPEEIEASQYILTVVLTWDPGPQADNLPVTGTVNSNDLQGFLFQDPPVHDSTGGEVYSARTNGTLPGNMIAVSPSSGSFNLVVANFSGVNNGYKLEVSLTNAAAVLFDPSEYQAGNKPPSYVQPTSKPPAPTDTPQDSGFGGSSGPPIGSPSGPVGPVTGGESLVVPNIAGGRPDTGLLAASQITVKTGLGRKALDGIDNKIAVASSEKASGPAIWLTLLALPVLAAGFGVFLMRRRNNVAAPLSA